MDRRELIQLLGVGAVGSLSGCAGLIDPGEDLFDRFFGPGSTPTPAPEPQRRISVIQSQLKQVRQRQPTEVPELNFDYEPAEFDEVPDSNFDRIAAQPVDDLDGDWLRITPKDVPAEELAHRLRIVWGAEDTPQTSTTIASTTVAFRGDQVDKNAYLVGVLPAADSTIESDTVLAARATGLEDAVEIAEGIDLEG